MSNVWEYRFAFPFRDPEDVPPEFRPDYERLVQALGPPALAFFSPTVEEPGLWLSRRTPVWAILVFSNSLAILGLERGKPGIRVFTLGREDLLGFGLAEFLLDCWLSLDPGPLPGAPLKVRFPSRAMENYSALLRHLADWSGPRATLRPERQPTGAPNLLQGLPTKFIRALEAQSHLFEGAWEYFYQPLLRPRRGATDGWANTLLLLTPRGVVALSDEHRGGSSEYGLDWRLFPLAHITHLEWVEGVGTSTAHLQLSLKGRTCGASVSWPVYRGLKPYACRLLDALEFSLSRFCGVPDGASITATTGEPGQSSTVWLRNE